MENENRESNEEKSIDLWLTNSDNLLQYLFTKLNSQDIIKVLQDYWIHEPTTVLHIFHRINAWIEAISQQEANLLLSMDIDLLLDKFFELIWSRTINIKFCDIEEMTPIMINRPKLITEYYSLVVESILKIDYEKWWVQKVKIKDKTHLKFENNIYIVKKSIKTQDCKIHIVEKKDIIYAIKEDLIKPLNSCSLIQEWFDNFIWIENIKDFWSLIIYEKNWKYYAHYISNNQNMTWNFDIISEWFKWYEWIIEAKRIWEQENYPEVTIDQNIKENNINTDRLEENKNSIITDESSNTITKSIESKTENEDSEKDWNKYLKYYLNWTDTNWHSLVVDITNKDIVRTENVSKINNILIDEIGNSYLYFTRPNKKDYISSTETWKETYVLSWLDVIKFVSESNNDYIVCKNWKNCFIFNLWNWKNLIPEWYNSELIFDKDKLWNYIQYISLRWKVMKVYVMNWKTYKKWLVYWWN